LKPTTWIHTADLHLDRPIQGWNGSKEEACKRREDYRETFKRIISLVKQKQVGFLFIAGDFLEHGFIQSSTVKWIKEHFLEIPNTKIFISPGNHDPYRFDSYYHSKEEWPQNVHIFTEEWQSLYIEEYDICLYGKGFSDYIESMWIAPPDVHKYRKKIMIVHGTFFPYGSSDEKCQYFPIEEKNLSVLEFDYVALGHIHKPQLFILDNQRKTHVCYPGSPEAVNWKETGIRTVTYGCLDEHGIHLESIPIHTRTYEKLHCDLSQCQTREQVLTLVLSLISSNKLSSCFKIYLQGRRAQELDLQFNFFWLNAQLKQEGLYQFSIIDETIPDFNLTYYRQQIGVVGTFVRKIEEKIKRDPTKKTELEGALYKGLEALFLKERE
jgi:DNA repair protein SbcD/Mre11